MVRVRAALLLTLVLLCPLLFSADAAHADAAQDQAIAFAAFTTWCQAHLGDPRFTTNVEENASYPGRWCRFGIKNLCSVAAYDLTKDADGFKARVNAKLGDSAAAEREGGDVGFCVGGIEWMTGGFKFYIMLWRDVPHTPELGKQLIAEARRMAALMDVNVMAAVRKGEPPAVTEKELPVLHSTVFVVDRSNCLATNRGDQSVNNTARKAARYLDSMNEQDRLDSAHPLNAEKLGLREWALLDMDSSGFHMAHGFTRKVSDTENSLASRQALQQVEQADDEGRAAAPVARDISGAIARAATYAYLAGQGQPHVIVLNCGAKPTLSAQGADALNGVLGKLSTVSVLNTDGGRSSAGALNWWAGLIQAAFGQTGAEVLEGTNEPLATTLARLEETGRRVQRPLRVSAVGVRFEAGGEQETLLRSVCEASKGAYAPARSLTELSDSLVGLLQRYYGPGGGGATGTRVAQETGGTNARQLTTGGPDDALHLRDGRVLRGTAISHDDRTVVFRTAQGVSSWPRSQVAAIVFGQPAESPGLPPEISLAPGLRAARWLTFHRLPRFDLGPLPHAINNAKISANGQRIIVAANEGGTASLNADGSGLVRLSEARSYGLIDISADGRTVAWADANGIYAARSDGTDRRTLPGGFSPIALRLTANGERLYVMTLERGLLLLPTDGSDVRRILSTEDVAAVAGLPSNNNSWRGRPSGLDVSDDGTRLVFHFGRNVMACNGDGSGLRKLTDLEPARDSSIRLVRISGDGTRIGWLRNAPELSLNLQDWDGGNQLTHRENGLREALYLQLSRDGNTALASHGARFYGGRDASYLNLTQWGQSNYEAVYNTTYATFTADARRILLVTGEPISPDAARPCPLVIAELNPMQVGDVPPLREINVQPRFLLTDGATNATATVRTGHPNLDTAGLGALQRGELLPAFYYWGLPLLDKGANGDEKAGDGLFSTNAVRISKSCDPKVEAGPMTLRIYAQTKASDALVVDFTGVEARTP